MNKTDQRASAIVNDEWQDFIDSLTRYPDRETWFREWEAPRHLARLASYKESAGHE